MKNEIWIENQKQIKLKDPIAVVGSPGLGSIGKLVVDELIKESKAELTTSLYSSHFPVVYHTIPAYLAHYAMPGVGGIKVEKQKLDLPKVKFFTKGPSLILANGYHANFAGAYEIAEKVVDILKDFGTKRIIITAGFGSEEKKVCCAATSLSLIHEMKEKYNLATEYQGPFYGFCGLVFGAAKLKEIEAISLFAGVEPKSGDPEALAKDSSKMIVDILKKMIDFT